MTETLTQKIARLKALREKRYGTPEQRKARQQFLMRIRKAEQRVLRERVLRDFTGAVVRQIEAETGTRAPETVKKFIRGEY